MLHNLAFQPHDHARCASGALSRADAVSAERGLRFTPVRRRTLEILLASHRAMGAYEVLDQLGREGFGRQPPVVYRALDFLVENGFAHRIRRANAFLACATPGEDHAPAFLICRGCDRISEVPGAEAARFVVVAASADGFEAERVGIEATGLCAACRTPE